MTRPESNTGDTIRPPYPVNRPNSSVRCRCHTTLPAASKQTSAPAVVWVYTRPAAGSAARVVQPSRVVTTSAW